MPFKLPNYPSPQAHVHELADFVELLAWMYGKYSARDLQSYLGQIDDNQDNVGIEDSDLENENLSDEVALEIGQRIRACNGSYPFYLDKTGSILTCGYDVGNTCSGIYLYLLMATRLNMQKEKVKTGIDGTGLLEELSSRVLRTYLGHERACSLVFGTAVGGSFAVKVNDLCKALGEGGRFLPLDPGKVNANDDSLDVVGWIPFADQMHSKLSVFAQCKTGTSWDSQKTELVPSGFITRWMSDRTFIFDPIRSFFIAESADRAHWCGTALYTGLLFDRCRIVDYSGTVESDLLLRIQQWTESAKNELLEKLWGKEI